MPKIEKPDAEWRTQLTPSEYHVTREKGTEQPFTGQYWNCNDPGTYHCICCAAPLFRSEAKFDAGCGWPSFHCPHDENLINEHVDRSFGMIRTEVTCHDCGAHLGHVFTDGPAPGGPALLHQLDITQIEQGSALTRRRITGFSGDSQ